MIGPIHRLERHKITIEPVLSFKHRRVTAGKELPLKKMTDHLVIGVEFIAAEVGQVIVLKIREFFGLGVEPFDPSGSHLHRGFGGVGYLVDMPIIDFVSAMVELLGEDHGRGGLSAGAATHQLYFITHGDFATFNHKMALTPRLS